MKHFDRSALLSAFRDTDPSGIRRKTLGLFATLLLVTLLLWVLVFVFSISSSAFFGYIALLAYGLGVAHAFHAPNIAAMNVAIHTMVRERKRPVAVSVFFALGYTTGIALMCLYLASIDTLRPVESLSPILGVLGALVCATFLFAAVKRVLYVQHLGTKARSGIPIDSSRKMYLVGGLFSLILTPSLLLGMLSFSALLAVSGLPLWSIILFAALFADGMALVGSVNSCLMTGVYQNAFTLSAERTDYDRYISGFTVASALFVGVFEILSASSLLFNLHNVLGDGLASLHDQTSLLGLVMLAVFLGSWGISTLFSRSRIRMQEPVAQALAEQVTPQDYAVTRPEDYADTTIPLRAAHDE